MKLASRCFDEWARGGGLNSGWLREGKEQQLKPREMVSQPGSVEDMWGSYPPSIKKKNKRIPLALGPIPCFRALNLYILTRFTDACTRIDRISNIHIHAAFNR